MSKYKYLTFPVRFLQFYSDNKDDTSERINKIIDEAILFFLKNRVIKERSVATQVYYQLLKHPNDINTNLKSDLDIMVRKGDLILLDPADIFIDGELRPGKELDAILKKMSVNDTFKHLCIELYFEKLTNDILGVYHHDFEGFWRKNKHHKTSAKVPIVSIRTDWVFDTREGKIPLDLFRIVCAIRSIVGRSEFSKTNKKLITSRMFGLRNYKAIQTLSDQEKAEREYYMNRYRFNRLINRAVERGFVAKIPAGRGFYVSSNPDMKLLEKNVMQSIDRKKNKQNIEKDAARRIQKYKKNNDPISTRNNTWTTP